MSHRRTLAALALGGLLAALTVAAPSGATTTGSIRVDPKVRGTTIGTYTYDLKQTGKAASLTDTLAAELVGDGFRMVRIPILATQPLTVHGSINPAYAEVVDAVKRIKAAAPKGERVQVFASLKTNTDCVFHDPRCKDFAASMHKDGTTSSKVVPSRYASYVARYVAFLQRHHVHVDVLGFENEPGNHDDEFVMTTSVFAAMARQVDGYLHDQQIGLPRLVANDSESSNPGVGFARSLTRTHGWARVAATTFHTNSELRHTKLAELRDLAAAARGHAPMWNSEFHYTDLDKAHRGQDWQSAKLGLTSFFDNTDNHLANLTWWSFVPGSAGTAKGRIESQLVRSTLGSVPLATDDRDGSATAYDGIVARAYRRGSVVQLWVLNSGPTRSQPISIAGMHVTTATFERWVAGSSGLLQDSGTLTAAHDGAGARISLAHDSVTRVRLVVR